MCSYPQNCRIIISMIQNNWIYHEPGAAIPSPMAGTPITREWFIIEIAESYNSNKKFEVLHYRMLISVIFRQPTNSDTESNILQRCNHNRIHERAPIWDFAWWQRSKPNHWYAPIVKNEIFRHTITWNSESTGDRKFRLVLTFSDLRSYTIQTFFQCGHYNM